MARLPEGFRLGHWTDPEGRSGCTVVLPPRGNVTSCDIRGSAPSSRELVLLDLDRRLTEVHGIVLTGGSAFGLASAHGVVEWLAERGIGYQTTVATVPIVPAAVINDLRTAGPGARPGAVEGRAACDAADDSEIAMGRVGVGAGATVGKWAGLEYGAPGGFGAATVSEADCTVTAVAVVNSVGDVLGPDGRVLVGTSSPEPSYQSPPGRGGGAADNTVLAVVATQAVLDKREVRWLAARGSDGIAASIRPAHTRYDGDVVFAVAAPPGSEAPPANLDILGMLATRAVMEAVRAAVA